MFNKTKDPTQEKPVGGNGTTIINAGTVLKGDIDSKNDIRIDGTIIGNIVCQAKIVIGVNGEVQGDIPLPGPLGGREIPGGRGRRHEGCRVSSEHRPGNGRR